MTTREKAGVPISTLIVDDEALARSLVSALVRRDPELMLLGECADGGEALQRIRSDKPDLVFLDIRMPVLSGINVVERLTESDHAPYIIFITAFDDYAIRAFELNVLDYLVKPVEKERFRAAVQRAKDAIRNREIVSLTNRLMDLKGAIRRHGDPDESAQELTVRKGEQIVQLSTSDIVWIEAANQYVNLHTLTDTFTVSESLSQYTKKIRDPRLVRIHRSAVVNAAAIASVSKKRNGTHLLRLETGQELVVARSRSSLLPSLLRIARTTRTGL